jgi:hypothetical protein
VSKWFINFEFPIAIAMISTIPLIGSFLNGIIVPHVFEKENSFGDAFRVGFILCVISLVMSIGVNFIDRRMDKVDENLLKNYKKEIKQRDKKKLV